MNNHSFHASSAMNNHSFRAISVMNVQRAFVGVLSWTVLECLYKFSCEQSQSLDTSWTMKECRYILVLLRTITDTMCKVLCENPQSVHSVVHSHAVLRSHCGCKLTSCCKLSAHSTVDSLCSIVSRIMLLEYQLVQHDNMPTLVAWERCPVHYNTSPRTDSRLAGDVSSPSLSYVHLQRPALLSESILYDLHFTITKFYIYNGCTSLDNGYFFF